MAEIKFRPRRLGHVNLYVSQLERSIAFYERTCGLELVRLEPAIRGAFHSIGNTHHDVGMIEVSKGADRNGRDGNVQIAAQRGVRPGLNHLGWEMASEAQLVAAYRRLRAAGFSAVMLFDHIISHAVYVNDPDGNVHEFYADVIPDWREVFNLEHEDLVTSQWDPEAAPANAAEYYPAKPAIRHVAGAPLQPISITGATFATSRFDAMKDFLVGVAGLEMSELPGPGLRRAQFAGDLGRPDFCLTEVAAGARTGLRLFSFMLEPGTDFAAVARSLASPGAPAPRFVEDDRRRAVVLADPDGSAAEFYWPKSGEPLAPLAA